MLCIPGSPALSEFRLKKLQQQIDNLGFGLTQVSSQYIHLVEMAGIDLSDNDYRILLNLLTYGPSSGDAETGGLDFLVMSKLSWLDVA